jgi:uncharacterized protein
MFRIDLRAAARAPVATEASLAADDPLFADLDFVPAREVRVTGRLSMTGPGRYYWSASIETMVVGSCRRCLEAVEVPIRAPVSLWFTEGGEEDDPSVWAIPERSVELDLGDPVREELILAVPEYVLCREDCRGLCDQCGQDLNVGSCTCRRRPDQRWSALEQLRGRLPE